MPRHPLKHQRIRRLCYVMDYAATDRQSAAQVLQASAQALHSLTLSENSLHSFSQAVQTPATSFANVGVKVELTEAKVWSARQAAMSWTTKFVHALMLVSFIENIARQCRRQSSPVATHLAVESSSDLYLGGCISRIVCALVSIALPANARAPTTVMISRRFMLLFLSTGFPRLEIIASEYLRS